MGMDIGKFLKNPEFDIRISTYRDIFQAEELESDRFGVEYAKHSAVIMLSKGDLEKTGLKIGDRVKLSNKYGTVVVEVRVFKRDEPGGIAFMINSPWSNVLVSDETGGRGIPEFKDIRARISLTKDEITPLEKLIL